MILLTYGTRPEYIKIKPIINELKERNKPFKVLFTGQHENIANGYFDIRLKFETYTDHNRLDNIIANLMTLNDSAVFENISSVIDRKSVV
jgi:UDP-N-acetylglucosamine 2-epimerase